MIRINLLGGKVKPKRSGSSYQILIYLVVVAAVFGVVYLWHGQQVDQIDVARRRATEASDKVEGLKRVKQAWEAWLAEKAVTDSQTKVFQALQADQIGPSMAIQYLSYALTRVPDDAAHQEEAKAQEIAGWNPKWDTRRVWIKSIEVKNGTVEIKGEALDHEDVAEFYRRLESSDIFTSLDSPSQRRRVHEELDIKYIDFSFKASISFVATAIAWGESEVQAAVAQPETADSAAPDTAGQPAAATAEPAAAAVQPAPAAAEGGN